MSGLRASLLACGLLSACSDPAATLVLDLRTDYVPGVEFDSVETVLDDGTTVRAAADAGADFVAGVRVAEIVGLPRRALAFEVRLRRAGTRVDARPVRVALRSDTSVTVVMTRDCLRTTCPAPGGDPALTACVAGRCATPECVAESPDDCGPPECAVAADCAAADCARPTCVAGACLFGSGDCPEGTYCDPDVGCRRLEAEPDGGRPDAGVDAGPADPGGWARVVSGDDAEEVSRLAGLPGGGLVAAGTLRGDLDLGGGVRAADGGGLWVARYDADGTHRWSTAVSGSGTVEPGALVVDGAARVQILGKFSGTVDFGEGPVRATEVANLYLLTLDLDDGERLGSRVVGYAHVSLAAGAVDSEDHLFVCGTTLPGSDLGGGALAGDGLREGFLASYDSDGGHRWSLLVRGGSEELAVGVGISGDRVCVAGTFSQLARIGGTSLRGSGRTDGFVTCHDRATGAVSRRRTIGGADGRTTLDALTTSRDGGVFVAGRMDSDVDFGGRVVGTTGRAAFVARYDADLNLQWVRAFDAPMTLSPGPAVVGGTLFVPARSVSSFDFGGGPLPPPPGRGGLVIGLDAATGDYVEGRAFVGSGGLVDQPLSVTGDGRPGWLVGGRFSGAIDLGFGPVPDTASLDGFIVRTAGP